MNTSDDDILFADDSKEELLGEVSGSPWKVLIVDDAKEIHDATRMVLSDVSFRNRGLEFLSAYSAAEAHAILATTQDIAVIFLDVVMEHDHAGLDLVQTIRQELKNETVRIILRTGQPGQAPEREVIVKYDINDYKNKSELTVDKLFTSLISALRSYQDLLTIEASRRGLERILEGSTSLLKLRSTEKFLSGVLLQMDAMFQLGADTLLCVRQGNSVDSEIEIAIASGRYEQLSGKPLTASVLPNAHGAILHAFSCQQGHYEPGKYTIYFHADDVYECVIFLERGRALSEFDRALMNIFCTTAAVGLNNIHTLETLEQKVNERTHALHAANQQLEIKAFQLEQIASTDALTGVNSRRHFFQLAENLVYAAKRHQRPLTVIILDIDHFKKINDQYGHAAGDVALRRCAQSCAKGLRESDVFGRLGGEEFAIALPETGLDGAKMVAERIRDILKAESICTDGSAPLTVSIGVAQWQAAETTIEFTINRADNALYEAKRHGRNRIEISS